MLHAWSGALCWTFGAAQAAPEGPQAVADAASAGIDDLPNPPDWRSKNGLLTGTLDVASRPWSPCAGAGGQQRHQRQLPGADHAGPARRHDRRQGGQRHRPATGRHRRPAADQHPLSRHGRVAEIAQATTCSSASSPNRDLRYDVFDSQRPPAGPALVPCPRPHLRRRPDRLRRLRHADRRRLHRRSSIPELAGLRQRVMVLKDFTFPGFKDGDARAKSLNGYANPPIRARPGEFQIWELGNLGADAFFDLKLEGHRVWVIERDGNPAPEARAGGSRVPAARVRAPPWSCRRGAAGRYSYRASQRRHRARGRSEPDGQDRHLHRRGQPGRRRQRHPATPAPGAGRPQPDPTQLRVGGQAQGRPDALHRLLRERRRQHVLHQPQDLQREPRRHDHTASGKSSAGSCATSRRRCTSSTCTRPSS